MFKRPSWGNHECKCGKFASPATVLPKCYTLTVGDENEAEMCSCSPSDREDEYNEEAGKVLSGCLYAFAFDEDSRRPSYCVECTLILLATNHIDLEELRYLSEDFEATMNALITAPKELRLDQCVIDIVCNDCTRECGEVITQQFDPFAELSCNDFTCVACDSVLKHCLVAPANRS